MALSKNRIKYIHSLEQKKNRKADKVFLAEGDRKSTRLNSSHPK